MSLLLVQGNALSIPLADKSVQCIVTSPPYWGLRSYATGDNKTVELGSEALHDCLGWATGHDCGKCYLCHMRQVARECWRVLRDDGVMFWNIADSYAAGAMIPHAGKAREGRDMTAMFGGRREPPPGLKPKDKCGIPERTALAFQSDGWWWRSDIIWHKPNPMPESVTDRPTKSHEFIHLFTKAERYFWDAEAVREAHQEPWRGHGEADRVNYNTGGIIGRGRVGEYTDGIRQYNPAGRNLRDVWTLATQAYPGAHFATYPSELPRRCIKAGTSERGACPKCGKGWERVRDSYIEHTQNIHNSKYDPDTGWAQSGWKAGRKITTTLGWRAACTCDAGDPVPCIVLDPFSGAATTGLVARELGRHYIGLELSAEYLKQSRDRLSLTALDEWGNGRKHEADLTDLPMFKV